MRLAIGLTLLLGGCTCATSAPPSAPTVVVQAPAIAPAPVDHGALTYEWHTRLPTGAFTGLRAWEDGAVEVGGSSVDGLAWAPLRTLSVSEHAVFQALREGPIVAALPKLIPDATAPLSARVTWTIRDAVGERKIMVEGANRTRIPALEELDRTLTGLDTQVPRRSFLTAQTASGIQSLTLPCDALSQRAFRGVVMAIQDVPTPGATAPTAPTLLRVENVSLMQSAVVEIRDDGALVRMDDDGTVHVGQLTDSQLLSIRSTLDHLSWSAADGLCKL